MAGVTPKIETKFSLSGLREASSGLRRFGAETRAGFARIKKETAEAFKPAEKDIQRLQRSMRVLKATSIGGATLGFKGLEKAASTTFRTIKVSAIAATAAVTGIGIAAVKASKDSAAQLAQLDDERNRLGINTEDLSVLKYAAHMEGANPDDLTKGIARIAGQFVDVRRRIAQADDAFTKFRNNARGDALAALLGGDQQGVLTAGTSVAAERLHSLAGIRERQAQLQNMLAQADTYGANPLFDRLPQGQRGIAQATYIHQIRKELDELQVAQQQIVKSVGPTGEVLFGLEKYGLDVTKATRGGVDGFLALGDAMKKVEDPSQRLRYAIQLFGEDAGPKMLPLMMKGRKGIEDYRKELERLGGVVTDADAKLGAAYEDSVDRRNTAISGLKLAVARELLPSLTDLNKRGTEFLVRYRATIARFVKTGFDAARDLGADAVDAFNGRRSGFRTGWLNTAVAKIREIRQQIAGFRKEIGLAFQGRSNYAWLNRIAGGLKQARAFAMDVVAVFRGGDAKDFKWINEVRDWIKGFITDAQAAFRMFRETLKPIVDNFIKPLSSFLGTDLLTTSLYLGMLRFSGVLGLILTTLRGIGSVGKTVFGLGAGLLGRLGVGAVVGEGGAAAATAAATGVAGKAGKAATAATVAASSIDWIKKLANTSITQILKGGGGLLKVVGRLGAAVGILYTAWKTGQWAGEILGKKAYDWTLGRGEQREQDRIAALMRARDTEYQGTYSRLRKTGSSSEDGGPINVWGLGTDMKNAFTMGGGSMASIMASRERSNPYISPETQAGADAALAFVQKQQPTETIALKVDINGKSATGNFPAVGARSLVQEARRAARMGE